MPNIPKPTGRSVNDLHKKLMVDWSVAVGKNLDLRDLVHQKNPVDLPEETEDRNIKLIEIHAGRAGGLIDHATGLINALPAFHVEPLKQTTEEARETDKVERAYAKLFEQQLLGTDFWNRGAREILTYGYTYFKAIPLSSSWTAQQGYPVRGKKETGEQYLARVRRWKMEEGNFPFIIEHVPSLSILAHLDNNDEVLASIEIKWVTAQLLADEFDSPEVKEALSRRSVKWYDELEVIEYIDPEWVGYFLVDTTPVDKTQERRLAHERVKTYKPLRIWRHGLGVHPIVCVPGLRTEMDEYEDRFKSFLSDAKDALETYDVLLSRLATMTYAFYLPSYKWTIKARESTMKNRDRPVLKVNLGGVTTVYDDEDLEMMPLPASFPDASLMLANVDDIIQRSTLEDVLFGRVAGSAPAFQVNLRINVAKSRLQPITQHMAQGLTKLFRRFAKGVEWLGEAVNIGGETLTVSQAKRFANRTTAQIEPKSPVDRSQDLGSAAMALDIGLPWVWTMEQILDIEDPATLQLQKDIEELEKLPEVRQRLLQDALEQLDVKIEEEELVPLEGLDLSQLTPEVAAAIQQLLAQGAGGEGLGLEELLGPEAEPSLDLFAEEEELPAPFAGPLPEGAAPQQLAPRGLLTPNEQVEPGEILGF